MENNAQNYEYDKDEEEQRHFKRIIRSFRAYNSQAKKHVDLSLSYFYKLPANQKSLLYDFEDNCKTVLKCVNKNYEVIKLILEDVEEMFENTSKQIEEKESEIVDQTFLNDVDRVFTTLKQVVRDWSEEGASERDSCYTILINELMLLNPTDKSNKCVLVPGSGLGRLAYEIAVLGFICEGNEFSLHMLMASNFILNKCYESNQYTIYPYTLVTSNNLDFEDQVRPITFPDISPFEFSNESLKFSMAAGDFLEIYNLKDKWDYLVTCFFIDTAHNIIDYIEKIWSILKPGGYWLNFGPLLYHFSSSPNEKSIELSYKQIKRIIEKIGFKYTKENVNMSSEYIHNKKSMLQYKYNSVFFVVQKPNQ